MANDRIATYPDLAGRTAFVSGGGTGIGAALVEHFAAQGCPVGFVDIDEAPSLALAERLSPRPVRFVRCDVRDTGALQRAVADIVAALGPVRVLVNNAARDDRHALADVTAEYWDNNMAVNLRHHFFAAQAVAPGMAAAGGGAIVNMGSVAWMRGRANLAAYATAKAAIAGMTRVLARELGERGIRVNSVAPGAIVTERQKALWAGPADEQRYLEGQCLKFRLSVADVARAVLFLASDEARGITGQTLVVDAGLAQTSAV